MSFFNQNAEEYIEEIRKVEPTDPAHADVINELAQNIINNEAFLKKLSENIAENLNEHLNDTGNPHDITPAGISALPLIGGTLIGDGCSDGGYIQSRSKSVSWIDLKTLINTAFSVSNQPNNTGWYGALSAKTKSGNVWSIGTINDEFRIVGFKADTKNGNPDWGMVIDTSEGNMSVTGTLSASSFLGNATSATKATQDGNGNVISDTYALEKDVPIYKNYNVSSDNKLITSLKDNIVDIIGLTSGISPAIIRFGQMWTLVGTIDSYQNTFYFVACCRVNTGQMYSGYCNKNKINGIYEHTGTLKDV